MDEQVAAKVVSFPTPALPSLKELAQRFWKELLGTGNAPPNQSDGGPGVGEIFPRW